MVVGDWGGAVSISRVMTSFLILILLFIPLSASCQIVDTTDQTKWEGHFIDSNTYFPIWKLNFTLSKSLKVKDTTSKMYLLTEFLIIDGEDTVRTDGDRIGWLKEGVFRAGINLMFKKKYLIKIIANQFESSFNGEIYLIGMADTRVRSGFVILRQIRN